jgi:hypothetical protein
MHYIKDVKSLSEFAKTLSDAEISIAVAEYENKRYSQLTTATHSLNNAILAEWRVRHGNKPIPRVIPETEMVFQKGSTDSCKFIKHLL